ncbi:SNARE protein TLG1/Syntaxin 6 [Phaffia rhodozyma]|uniref:SNARE protein TLG1/Syntaxin 6 n=1 Tax=Phaffia rhodozyma TaxID=264483 RepID=A0A0F7SXU4_PHARH|nr:SNARE protein TLG1/Syntaxin 6 [Phaffia rhodozyma]
MGGDPYFDVKQEVESTLLHLQSLVSQYHRALSSYPASSREVISARDEVRGTISSIDVDLEDLEESVRAVVEGGDGQFGILDGEIQRRKGFLKMVKAEVESIRASIVTPKSTKATRPSPSQAYRDEEEGIGGRSGPPNGETEAWEREEQLSLMRNQDDDLHLISGTLNTLHDQAHLMGREVGEQNMMLEDLSDRVDSTEDKLGRAMGKLKEFVAKSEATSWGFVYGVQQEAPDEEEDDHQAAVIRGGIRGAAYSVAAMVPIFGAAYKYSHYYRIAPLPLKAFGAIVLFAPAVVIEAENEGLRYEKSLWTGAGKVELDEMAKRQVTEWDRLSRQEKALKTFKENQWAIVGGSWVASMAGSGAYFYRNPYLTNAQKVVNSRMVAQGLTVLLILGSAYLTYQPKDEAHPSKPPADHSWAYILEANEKEEAQEKLALAHRAFKPSSDKNQTGGQDPSSSAQNIIPMNESQGKTGNGAGGDPAASAQKVVPMK